MVARAVPQNHIAYGRKSGIFESVCFGLVLIEEMQSGSLVGLLILKKANPVA